ncbi:ATP-binding protein [Haloarcula sediminis]|uniref:ATP-binding protein n=1 Tax=Haloarcula sediminis TaxID=3111777 RepID=UPI002D79C225|nr:ATP-binding protein [Haloarcula sp. CK38]
MTGDAFDLSGTDAGGAGEAFEESVTVSADPFHSFDALAGYEEQKAELRRTVVEPAAYDIFGTTSALLFGESAEARTSELARGLAGQLGSQFTYVSVESVVGHFDESYTSVGAALRAAREQAPSLVVLDCLDEFGFDEAEYRTVQQHLTENRQNDDFVIVVGTATEQDADLRTNQSIFEVTVRVPAPDEQYRREIVAAELAEAQEAGAVAAFPELDGIETRALSIQLLRTAVKRALQRRRREEGGRHAVTLEPNHLQAAIDGVADEQFEERNDPAFFGGNDPNVRFEPDIPAVSFDDIGGLREEKRRIREAVTVPVEYSETFHAAGFSVGQGILLHGPPGNGKTMLAKAVANDLDYHFLSVKGPELEQPFVGESERQLRELFDAAREHAPTVLFFDEFDSLAPSRASDAPAFKSDMVNALLSELDGLEPLTDILVIAATNRLDHLDDAVIRSGRFDTFIEVPMPNAESRADIFSVHAADLPLADGITTEWATSLDLGGLSGADITTVCRKALELAVCDHDNESQLSPIIQREHVREALDRVRTDPTDTGPTRSFR